MKKNDFPSLFPRGRRLKILMTMKMIVFLTLVLSLTASASIYSQNQRVNLDFQGVSVLEAFNEIKAQTGLRFIYNEDRIEELGSINFDATDMRVDEALEEIFKDTNLECQFHDDVIMIIDRKSEAPKEVQQEKKQIKGIVTDEDGYTLPGVSVVVKGTMIGTATDIAGNFSIEFLDESAILVFSFIGMTSQEIVYKGQSVLNVSLIADSETMDEVVVTGYFKKNKNSFTGSVVSVKSEEIQAVSNSNLLSTIQSFDPSFSIKTNNLLGSDPNALPDVTIRGGSSLPTDGNELRNNPNMPVYILDGFQVTAEKIFDLDMSRVKSFTILKDASATAIYGSRAANGVVVIETKSPKAGKLQVFYNYDLTVSAPDLSDYNLLNAREKLEYEKLADVYDVRTENVWGNKEEYGEYTAAEQKEFDKLYNQRLYDVENGVDTYWLAKPVQTSLSHKHSLSLEGGDEFMRYGLNLYMDDSKGVMRKSGRKKYAADVKLLYRHKNLQFQNVLSVSDVSSDDSPFGSYSNYAQSNPYFKFKDEDGNYTKYLGVTKGHAGNNHFYNYAYNAYETNNFASRSYTDISDQFMLDWRITEALKAKASVNVHKKLSENKSFESPESVYSFHMLKQAEENNEERPVVGYYYTSNAKTFDIEGRLSLSYQKIIGKNIIDAFVNYEVKETEYELHSFEVEDFTNDKMVSASFASQYAKDKLPGGIKETTRQVGFLSNLSYTWDGKYLADFSYRVDGSSAFGANKHFAPFWSTGLAWNIHKENFVEDSFISYLKIKANTGVNGSVSFEPFQGVRSYGFITDRRYENNVGANLLAIGNKDLAWQETTNRDIGLDLGLFDDKFTLNATYYHKSTEGQITNVSLAPSIGFTSYLANIGTVENKGFELQTKLVCINNKSSNVYLAVWGRLAHNENEITKISDNLKEQNELILKAIEEEIIKDGGKKVGNSDIGQKSLKPIAQFEEGASIFDIRAVRSMGIDPSNGKEIYQALDGTYTYDWNPRDQVVVGSTEPDFQGNFGFDARYKNFSLNASFYYRYGGQVFNQTLLTKVENANPYYNVDKRVLTERWKQAGDVAKFKDIKDRDITRMSSRFVEDDNLLSLQRVSLGYDFNKEFISRLGLNSLKMSVYMADIVQFSSVKMERGLNYPFARSVSFSLKCNF